MNAQYFRVTGYHPGEDLAVIVDSFGKHSQLWQFSIAMSDKGFKVVAVSNATKFIDVNTTQVAQSDKFILRSSAKGQPESTTHIVGGVEYFATKVGNKIYIPDRDKKVEVA